jgi:hypothetical protein
MSHTPGPWNIHPAYINDEPMQACSEDGKERWNWLTLRIAKGNRLIGSADFNDCVDCGWPRIDDVEEARANARLMVAAPELLAALQIIADSEEHHGFSFVCDFSTLQGVARAAIAKATGGA